MQNLKTFEKALKEHYLPVWNNQLGIEPSALLGKIKKVPLVGNKVVASAPVGLSGGFGFGEEGRNTPAAGGVRFERFETNAKDMYVNVCISAKATRLTGTAGAMASALDTEVKAAYETAKWNMGRALFGNGTGKLATITGGTGNTVTVDDTKFVKEGLIVDFYEDGAKIGADPVVAGRRILAVDRANNMVRLSGETLGVTSGFMTVQNSYGLEITGLNSIFDDEVTELYGMKKDDNMFLTPTVMDCQGDIDDGIITQALRNAKNYKNGKVDTLLCGDVAYDAYVAYLRVNNIRVEDMSHTIQGGFKAIKFIFGDRVVDIINESFVPTDEMWGVNSQDLELHIQDWNFAELQDGGIFNLMENQSVYRALLANYGDLICKNPGGCVRLTSVGYVSDTI